MTDEQKEKLRILTDFFKTARAAANEYQCEDGTRMLGAFTRAYVTGPAAEEAIRVMNEILGPCGKEA